ncbi:MAG: CHAT domain-containing tetratricopeptide repeat protein [Ginsengibacter sp.]
MFLRNALLAILLLLTFIPQSQNNNEDSNYRKSYTIAEKFYNAENPDSVTDSLALMNYGYAISVLKKNNANDFILFDCYVKAGIISMSAGAENTAIHFFLESVELHNRKSFLPDSLLFQSYLYTGNSYYNIINMDSALYYYKQAESIVNRYPLLSEAERLYNQTGALYYATGDYKKSIIYFTKALSITEGRLPLNKYFVVNYKNNIASAYRKTGDYGQALTIYQSLIRYNINKNELLQNIGVTLLETGNYREAVAYLEMVDYKNESKYNDLARAYILLHKYDSATAYLNAALQIRENLQSTQKNIDHAYTLKYLGDINVQQGSLDKAINYYQAAVIQADPDFNDTNVLHNPTSFYGLHQSFFLFDALTSKAAAFQIKYASGAGKPFLIKSFETYASALELSKHVEKTYNSDEARFFLKETVDTTYKTAVELGVQLYETTSDTSYIFKVLKYIEDDKASVLQAGLQELQLGNIPSLPQGLLQEERKLKLTLSGLNNSLLQTKDSPQINNLRVRIQDSEIKIATVQGKLNDDPSYYRLKFNPPVVDIKSIREHTQSDEAIISYYYTNKRLLCFFITKDSFGYRAAPLRADMMMNITRLRNELDLQDRGDKEVVSQLSTSLYEILVKPVASILKNKKHLVIIPYNEISYIPFEILINPSSEEPLLNDFAISYNYSINFLSKYKTKYSAYKVLAMAPFNASTPDEKSLPVLKASGNEVAGLPGKILLGPHASKRNFLEWSAQYPVIHLATHAVVDNAAPLKSFIAFYPGGKDTLFNNNLFENEIYNLDLAHNQMVILSACETGNGQMINGEGIISLSRAFFYSGARSVATTLWKAEDVSITFITKHMHQYLMKGYDKDEALQKAKLDYLKSDEIDARFKIPAYWAPLVLSGDFNAIVKPSGHQAWLLILFGVLIILSVFILYRRSTFRAAG